MHLDKNEARILLKLLTQIKKKDLSELQIEHQELQEIFSRCWDCAHMKDYKYNKTKGQ
jgi:ABC-type sugar transport system ATPase subunit